MAGRHVTKSDIRIRTPNSRCSVLTVEFTVMGIPCLGLNGEPAFKHNEAFSFQVATADLASSPNGLLGARPGESLFSIDPDENSPRKLQSRREYTDELN